MSQYCVIEVELKTTIAKVVKIACLTYGTQGFLLLMMDNITSGKGVFQSLHVT